MRAVEFLQLFHPRGPWVLTAIKVDRKGIETTTFGPKTADEADAWVAARNGKTNLYFSVNLPAREMHKKAEREDIVLVPWLHVDVDARADEPLDRELERIRLLLTDQCPVLPPTFVTYSGGGYQAFWRLREPVAIDGLAAAEEMARYNRQLENTFGGDNCHNIDRIMRLPGTMNLPGAKKVAKGRVPAEAEVYSYAPEAEYDLSQFLPAPAVQVGGLNVDATVTPSANLERLEDVDALAKWEVPDRVRMIIVQGHDPDNPKGDDNSRSSWLFDVICQLVRYKVPDPVIYSVVTDERFAISESVLDKGSNRDKYALRQIKRAKEHAEEPWLRKMNDRHFVVHNWGGRCRVGEEVVDPVTKRQRLTKQTFEDLRNRYSNRFIQVGKKHVSVANWWLAHPMRREYQTVAFDPKGNDPRVYNLWQGFSCDPVPGVGHEPFLAHTLDTVCGGDQIHYDYLLGWMARAVQQPDEPGHTAVVLRGKSGVGKSFFATHFGHLFGRHFMQVSDAKHLVGAFNYHLRDTCVLFADEAFYAGDKKHESVLKAIITERMMMIEGKGVDAELSPNFLHIIMASNDDWVVPAGPTERRYFVMDVADNHRLDRPYFQAIAEELRGGGYGNLLHYLLSYDLSRYDVRAVPGTKALMEQKVLSMDPMSEWWYWRLCSGTLLRRHDDWHPEVLCEDLYEDYLNHARRFNLQRLGSNTKLGIFLGTVCPGTWPEKQRKQMGHSRPYAYKFPPLQLLRQRWEELYGETAWPRVAPPGEQPELPAPGDDPF